jgi:hypothetical protein
MTTEGSSPASLPKDLGLKKPWLLKGWVYVAEDVSVKVEAEVANPHSYLNLDAPLTHLKRRQQLDDQHADPHHWFQWASSITKALPTSPSASITIPAVKRWCVTSTSTSTLLTPL